MSTATSALTNKLYEVITGGQGVPRGSFISYVGGGIALDSAHMKWATQLPPYVGTADADNAYSFANIVDTIPIAAGPWNGGNADLGRNYRDIWLNNAMVPDVQLTAAQQTERDNTKKVVDQDLDDYTMYQGGWQNANMAFQLAVLAPRDTSYFQNLLQARQAASAAMTAWEAQGHKSEFEHALATYQHYEDLGLVNAVQNLKNDYDTVFNVNSTSTAQPFVPVSLFPNNFLEGGGPRWNHFGISESEFSRFQSSSSHSYSSGMDVDFLFWTLASGESTSWEERKGLNISTATLRADFDFIRVRINRSAWFDSFLLTSNSWWWPGATRSNPTGGLGIQFSDGVPPRNTQGQWQMIPTDMIITRNLVVDTGSFDLQHSEFASLSQSSSSAGFWIFSTSSSSSSSTSSSYTHTFNSNSTLLAPQPQIVAFICQLMPKEPNPATGLLPS
jgi:hypothetical protein